MGGGLDKEHMVIIAWDEEPTHITDQIRSRFPYIEVTYFCLKNANKPLADQSGRVPKDLSEQHHKLKAMWVRNVSGILLTCFDPIDLFKSATILVTLGSLPATAEEAPNLKLIHLFSAGIDHFAKHPIITDSDIIVTTSSGIHGPPIAEWVMMTTLAFSKHYAVTYELQKQHMWGGNKHHLSQGGDWVGKRVGIAGYGSIGRQVAHVFSALGSTIIAYTAGPRSTPSSRHDNGYIVPGTGDPTGSIPTAWFSGTTKTELHTFLSADLDALVLTLPLTSSTHHLISAPEFSLLSQHTNPSTPSQGKGCLVINISRGAIIDQPALVHALNTSQIRGACLDVADPEPLPKDDPLWDAKNVIITPHVSGLGVEYATRAYDVLTTNLARREKGEPLLNVVDRGKGY